MQEWFYGGGLIYNWVNIPLCILYKPVNNYRNYYGCCASCSYLVILGTGLVEDLSDVGSLIFFNKCSSGGFGME